MVNSQNFNKEYKMPPRRQPKFYYPVCQAVELLLIPLRRNHRRSMQKFHCLVWKNLLKYVYFFGILTSAVPALAVEIPNPIEARSFGQLIQAIANGILIIALPLAAVAITFVGFKFITGSLGGDTKKIGEAKTMFWWVLIGTAVAVGAKVLADVAVNFVKTLK